jgi:hypothetical protein
MAYAWHELPSARLAEPSAGVCDGRPASAPRTSERIGLGSVQHLPDPSNARISQLKFDGGR